MHVQDLGGEIPEGNNAENNLNYEENEGDGALLHVVGVEEAGTEIGADSAAPATPARSAAGASRTRSASAPSAAR